MPLLTREPLLSHEPLHCAGYASPRLHGVVDGVAEYGAVEESTGRRVVLKVVASTTAHLREAIESESAILAALGAHPNIITMYQRVVTSDGRVALALERCLGTFAQLFRPGATAIQSAVEMSIKLSGALETAHRGGVLHCGVRPENMMLTEYCEPALANFESAVRRSGPADAAPLLHDPTVHTAPELLLGEPPTEATDVYGLAATLYQLITGRPPFRVYEHDTSAAISARILCGAVTPLSGADVSPVVSDLLMWGLAAEPGARPPSAIWFAEELARVERLNGWARTPIVVGAPAVPGALAWQGARRARREQ